MNHSGDAAEQIVRMSLFYLIESPPSKWFDTQSGWFYKVHTSGESLLMRRTIDFRSSKPVSGYLGVYADNRLIDT